MKYFYFFILLFMSLNIKADSMLEEEINLLANLLTDQYASIVGKSVSQTNDAKRVYVTFSIEGFNLGNNFQQFLAVFRKEYKTQQEPPFAEYGSPKYRLIGYSHLCKDPLLSYEKNSLSIVGNKVSGSCEPKSSAKIEVQRFHLIISEYGLQ